MNYYGTAAGFTAYHTARGRDVSTYDASDIETALLIASEWLDGSYRGSWPGHKYRGRSEQIRDWPRSWVIDTEGYPVAADVVPIEVEQATYEMALRHLQDPMVLLVDYTPGKYKSVSIDGALSVEYRLLDAASVQKQFPIVGMILSGLMGGRGSFSPLSSAITRV